MKRFHYHNIHSQYTLPEYDCTVYEPGDEVYDNFFEQNKKNYPNSQIDWSAWTMYRKDGSEELCFQKFEDGDLTPIGEDTEDAQTNPIDLSNQTEPVNPTEDDEQPTVSVSENVAETEDAVDDEQPVVGVSEMEIAGNAETLQQRLERERDERFAREMAEMAEQQRQVNAEIAEAGHEQEHTEDGEDLPTNRFFAKKGIIVGLSVLAGVAACCTLFAMVGAITFLFPLAAGAFAVEVA